MKLFIVFAAPDRDQLQRLKLGLVEVRGGESTWSHYERDASLRQSSESLAAIEACDLFLALMSPDFLASNYCAGQELATAIMLHEAGRLRIVPIILEACEWKESRLGRLKPLPKLGTPVSEWQDPEQAYREIVAGLRAIVQHEQAASAEVGAGMAG
jgi:hypothetical protein